MDIKQADLNELLRDLEVRAHKEPTDFDKWLESASIYPGTTKVAATTLYAQYRQWWMDTPGMTGKLLEIRLFGKMLSRRFRAGRSAKGKFYYISRQATPNL